MRALSHGNPQQHPVLRPQRRGRQLRRGRQAPGPDAGRGGQERRPPGKQPRRAPVPAQHPAPDPDRSRGAFPARGRRQPGGHPDRSRQRLQRRQPTQRHVEGQHGAGLRPRLHPAAARRVPRTLSRHRARLAFRQSPGRPHRRRLRRRHRRRFRTASRGGGAQPDAGPPDPPRLARLPPRQAADPPSRRPGRLRRDPHPLAADRPRALLAAAPAQRRGGADRACANA